MVRGLVAGDGPIACEKPKARLRNAKPGDEGGAVVSTAHRAMAVDAKSRRKLDLKPDSAAEARARHRIRVGRLGGRVHGAFPPLLVRSERDEAVRYALLMDFYLAGDPSAISNRRLRTGVKASRRVSSCRRTSARSSFATGCRLGDPKRSPVRTRQSTSTNRNTIGRRRSGQRCPRRERGIAGRCHRRRSMGALCDRSSSGSGSGWSPG
jgi:hypothetical protein